MDPARWKKFLVAVALVWLLAAGLFVRVRGLSDYHLSPDDANRAGLSGQPTIAALLRQTRQEPHAPLCYIAQHFILRVSPDPFLVRRCMVGIGVMLIGAVFLLGRRVGNVAGLAAAAVIAFGFGPVLLSGTLREYIAAETMQALGLWTWLGYLEDRRPARLALLGAIFFISLLLSYPLALVIAALYLAWAAALLARRRPWAEWRDPALTAAFPAAAAALIYFIQGRYLIGSERFANPVEDWLKPFFFSDAVGFLKNLLDLFGYFTLPALALPAMALCLAGMIVLWRRGRPEPVLTFLFLLAINVAITLLGKYPLGGARHSAHFLPLVALGIGAAAQAGWEALRRRMPAGRDVAVAAAGVAVMVVATLALVQYYSGSDYLRRYNDASWREFPLTEGEYQAAMKQVIDNLKPRDLVFASYQTILYLEMETGKTWTPMGPDLGRVSYRGHDWFFVTPGGAASLWSMPEADEVRRAVDGLAAVQRLPPDARVWLINLGWLGPVKWVSEDPFWRDKAESRLDTPGSGLYVVPVESLLRGG